MTIGERIKTAREQAGITQVELGEKLGVSGVAVMRYEKNARQPRLEQLQAIADALNVPMPELMGLEQIDKYTWGREAGPEAYRKIAENIQRHHGAQARANKAMERMTEDGRNKVADYAEDILPRYRAETAPQSLPAPQEGKDTTTPPGVPETPPEGEQGGGEAPNPIAQK